jgi:hypothetical protein
VLKHVKVVKETTLNEYVKNAAAGNEDREKIMEEMVTFTTSTRTQVTTGQW